MAGTIVWWLAVTLPAGAMCRRRGQQGAAVAFYLSAGVGTVLVVLFALFFVVSNPHDDGSARVPFGSYEQGSGR